MAASTSEGNAAASASAVPWLDLPEDLTEKVLGRLPVHDYVRFGAVCRRWRAIQRDHRLRHSPSSPPALNIPWFIPYWPRQESVVCSVGLHSAEQRRLHIPFSSRYLAALESEDADEGTEYPACSSSPHGWLLFDDWPFIRDRRSDYEFSLLNPITGAQTRLPYLGQLYVDFKAAISPPPACDVFVLTFDYSGNKLHIYRRGNPDWTFVWCNNLAHDYGVYLAVASVIHYDGKFYCFRLGHDLMAFDVDGGSLAIEAQMKPHGLEMDQSLLPKDDRPWPDAIEDRLDVFLVESNGRMLLVCKFFVSHEARARVTFELFEAGSSNRRWARAERRTLGRFELFEADLSNRRWVRAGCLGDHALIIYDKSAISLVAADVGVKPNCIYVLDPPKNEDEPPAPWKMFDLSTGELADSSLPVPPSPWTHLMFLPSIY